MSGKNRKVFSIWQKGWRQMAQSVTISWGCVRNNSVHKSVWSLIWYTGDWRCSSWCSLHTNSCTSIHQSIKQKFADNTTLSVFITGGRRGRTHQLPSQEDYFHVWQTLMTPSWQEFHLQLKLQSRKEVAWHLHQQWHHKKWLYDSGNFRFCSLHTHNLR